MESLEVLAQKVGKVSNVALQGKKCNGSGIQIKVPFLEYPGQRFDQRLVPLFTNYGFLLPRSRRFNPIIKGYGTTPGTMGYGIVGGKILATSRVA